MPAVKGGWLEFERPEWERPERPERPGRPVDPGWGVDEGVAGGGGDLPVFPLEPGQGLPGEMPDFGQLPSYPPGTIWPPLDTDHHGKCIVGFYVVSGSGRRTHHYAVLNVPQRPDRPVDPGWGVPEGGAPGQGLPGRPEYPSQGPRPPMPQPPAGGIGGRPPDMRPQPPQPGQGLPRPPMQPPAGGIGGRPPQRPGPGYPAGPDYPAEPPGAGAPPTP